MDTKKIIVLGAMAVLGFVVFTGVRKLGTPAPTSQAEPQVIIQEAAVEYVSVLAIDADVSVGDRISEDIITEIEWPAEAVTPNLINTEDQPDAKQEFINALARTPMVAGETLTREKVIMAGDSGVMAAILKPGMRAVTVRISVDTAAGGFIQPGDKVDIILLMSVNPGFGGQSFIPSTLNKLKDARQRIDASGRDIRLEVDGGVKIDNIGAIAAAGADMFVAGSAIFGTKDYTKTITAMRKAINQA